MTGAQLSEEIAAPMKIVALVPEAVTARRCLEIAWAAASAANADLEVFHVKVDPRKLVTADEEVVLQRMRERREGTAEARAAAVRAIFEAWRRDLTDAAQSKVQWQEAVGAEEAAVAHESRQADLVVVPSPHNLDGGDANHAAFRKGHRPLLFVPDAAPSGRFAEHVAIAWKLAPQTASAVQGAAVWLRLARRVTTIMVADDLERAGWREAERLFRQLGISAEPILVAPGAAKVGAVLLQQAHELGADALVLGAYRHGDVIEWALPSTTRYVLHHADIPLFLAH